MSTIVYTTSTEANARRRRNAAAIASVARAARHHQPAPTYGQCLRCGGIEVRLTSVVGTRDYSDIGESSRYPIGHGCEACS